MKCELQISRWGLQGAHIVIIWGEAVGRAFFTKIRTSELACWRHDLVSSVFPFLICFFVVIWSGGGAWLLKAFGDYQKLSGSSTRHGWVDRGTRDGDRLRRPTPGRKLRSGAGSKGLRMLTKQKAEPLLGMKLTLLRSGHKKGGISCRGLGLETQPRIELFFIPNAPIPILTQLVYILLAYFKYYYLFTFQSPHWNHHLTYWETSNSVGGGEYLYDASPLFRLNQSN